jgi:hypothetical protein
MFYQRKTLERFAITFDEHVIWGPRAVLWYPFLKSLFPPEEQAIMPIQPMSESDDRWMPLQGADLFAWCTRRAYAAGSGFDYNWILEDMPDVQLSHHSQTINVARWEKIVRDAADVVLSPESERRAESYLTDERRFRWRCLFGACGFCAASTRRNPSLNRSIVPSGLSAGTSGGDPLCGFISRQHLASCAQVLVVDLWHRASR